MYRDIAAARVTRKDMIVCCDQEARSCLLHCTSGEISHRSNVAAHVVRVGEISGVALAAAHGSAAAQRTSEKCAGSKCDSEFDGAVEAL